MNIPIPIEVYEDMLEKQAKARWVKEFLRHKVTNRGFEKLRPLAVEKVLKGQQQLRRVVGEPNVIPKRRHKILSKIWPARRFRQEIQGIPESIRWEHWKK